MEVFNSGKTIIHFRDVGPRDGKVVVFANSLGTDMRLWDKTLKKMPLDIRKITYDKRGHGLSQEPDLEFSIVDLAADILELSEYLNLRNVTFVGVSIGGMIAQVLASKRPDIISKLVLCDTAVKIGSKDVWDQRIESVKKKGISSISSTILERWFSKHYISQNLSEIELLRRMLHNTSSSGYIECCRAISNADLTSFASSIKQPTLLLVGENDVSTPPTLVKETSKIISGSELKVIRESGHLPCIDNSNEFIKLLNSFCEN